MTPPPPAKSGTTLSITVKEAQGAWVWTATQVEPRPMAIMGGGSAPSCEQAWADAASVVNDMGEDWS